MQYYLFLFLAIVGELIGTTCLKLSDEFTNLIYSGICLLSYVACFYFLSLALNGINLNIAYAAWSALGIVAATLLSVFSIYRRDHLDGCDRYCYCHYRYRDPQSVRYCSLMCYGSDQR